MRRLVDGDLGVGVEHVGEHRHGIAVEVHDPAGDDAAVVERDDDGAVLVADLLAGNDDRLEQVARAEAAADAGQVGADGTPLVVEAVAGEAAGGGEESAAAVEVAPGQSLLDDRGQLVERPGLDERAVGRDRHLRLEPAARRRGSA